MPHDFAHGGGLFNSVSRTTCYCNLRYRKCKFAFVALQIAGLLEGVATATFVRSYTYKKDWLLQSAPNEQPFQSVLTIFPCFAEIAVFVVLWIGARYLLSARAALVISRSCPILTLGALHGHAMLVFNLGVSCRSFCLGVS